MILEFRKPKLYKNPLRIVGGYSKHRNLCSNTQTQPSQFNIDNTNNSQSLENWTNCKITQFLLKILLIIYTTIKSQSWTNWTIGPCHVHMVYECPLSKISLLWSAIKRPTGAGGRAGVSKVYIKMKYSENAEVNEFRHERKQFLSKQGKLSSSVCQHLRFLGWTAKVKKNVIPIIRAS